MTRKDPLCPEMRPCHRKSAPLVTGKKMTAHVCEQLTRSGGYYRMPTKGRRQALYVTSLLSKLASSGRQLCSWYCTSAKRLNLTVYFFSVPYKIFKSGILFWPQTAFLNVLAETVEKWLRHLLGYWSWTEIILIEASLILIITQYGKIIYTHRPQPKCWWLFNHYSIT